MIMRLIILVILQLTFDEEINFNYNRFTNSDNNGGDNNDDDNNNSGDNNENFNQKK